MPSTHPKAFLAFDFGAESGRAVLAHLHSGVLTIDEVHRFANDPVEYGGSLHWDLPRLWFEIRAALSALEDTDLAGIGVDSWGVDYALLGERGELLQNPYCEYLRNNPEVRPPAGCKLVINSPVDAFLTKIKMVGFLGLIVALPVVLYQLWGVHRAWAHEPGEEVVHPVHHDGDGTLPGRGSVLTVDPSPRA